MGILEAAHPTEVVRKLVESKTLQYKDANIAEGIQTFIKKAEGFDLRKPELRKYEKVFKDLPEKYRDQIRDEVKALIRTFQLSPTKEMMAKLHGLGLTSARGQTRGRQRLLAPHQPQS